MTRRRNPVGRPSGLVVLLATTLVALVIGGCSASSTGQTDYTNAEYGFSISYPSDFLHPVDDPVLLAPFKAMFGDQPVFVFANDDSTGVVALAATRESVPPNMREASARQYGRMLEQYAPDSKVVSTDSAKLGGLNGFKAVWQRRDNEYTTYHLYGKNAVFDVMSVHRVSDSSDNATKLREVVESFREVGSPPAPSSSVAAATLSQEELDYLESIVQASATLTRARTLADSYATALNEKRDGRRDLREALRLMSRLSESSPSPPSARLKEVQSQWDQALFYTLQSIHYFTKAITTQGWKATVAAQDRGESYRKKGFRAQARVSKAARELSAGSPIPGLTADLGADPYSFGNDSKVAYRKALWREYHAEANSMKPTARFKEIKSQFDEILDRRAAEWRAQNAWYAAPFVQ